MSTETPPMYVVLRTCTAGARGPEVEYRLPAALEDAREQVGHWREVARAGGRGCCRYDPMRLAPEHLWPLLDLTADELAALVRAADWTADRFAEEAIRDDQPDDTDPNLIAALDKLTGSTDA